MPKNLKNKLGKTYSLSMLDFQFSIRYRKNTYDINRLGYYGITIGYKVKSKL